MRLSQFTLFGIVAMALAACTAKENSNTFVYCSEASPEGFNPQITTSATAGNAASETIFSRLVSFRYGTTELVPALAESWEISDDKLSYTFKLRKGVKFHTTDFFTPTRDFNADDVIFSVNRQRLSDHPYAKVSGGNYEYFKSTELNTLIKDIVKIDDHTVQFKLSRVEAPFLATLAMGFMSIHSAEYADHLAKLDQKDKIDTHPVGTGPFVFKKYAKDTLIRYEANKSYFGGAPKIDRLVFAITPDANVRVQKLKAGECDLVIEPPPADLASLKENPELKVLEDAGMNIGYLGLNVEKEPLNNKKIRQAINHALNREAYIRAIYLGNARSAKSALPPNIWGYNDSIPDFAYDVELAKKLIAESGVATPIELELWTLPVTRPYNPNGKKMGELMQADLAKVGINVKLVSYDWPTYLAKARKGEHDLIQLGWIGDNGDPDNFLHVLLSCSSVESGSNVARWCNKEYNDLVVRAKQITDPEERAKLYQRAQEIFREEAPWAPIAYSLVFRAMKKDVSGYKMDPIGRDTFKYVAR